MKIVPWMRWPWLRRLVARPPCLPDGYNASDYARFMREETLLYSPRYAKQAVVIHGGQTLAELTRHRGAILAPLHYGSFFLSSGAIVHQLRLACTAIVTSRNLAVLPAEEEAFWRGVHQRSAKLYRQPLFHAGITPPREIVRYLAQPHRLLLAMLDVREAGHVTREYPFSFMQRQIHLQTGPARLARLANVPLVPMCIRYQQEEQRHHLHIGSPVWPDQTPIETTQQALNQLEPYMSDQPQQFFHDLANAFASPSNPPVNGPPN